MYLTPGDLTPFADIGPAKAQAMIEDAEATAATVAPCITEAEFQADDMRAAFVRALLRGAVLRWNESGTGAFQQQTAGPFMVSMDSRQQRRGMLWPSEIAQLQAVCSEYRGLTSQAFSVDTAPTSAGSHLPWCDVMFLGATCSCGAALTGGAPIYELGGS